MSSYAKNKLQCVQSPNIIVDVKCVKISQIRQSKVMLGLTEQIY